MYKFMTITLGLLLGAHHALATGSFAGDSYGSDSELDNLLGNILLFTNNVLIPFILGIGFLVFVYGMFQYFIAGGANDEKKEKGKSLAVYAVLGFVLVVIFWGIINLIATSTGLVKGNDNKVETFTAPSGVLRRGVTPPPTGGCGGVGGNICPTS